MDRFVNVILLNGGGLFACDVEAANEKAFTQIATRISSTRITGLKNNKNLEPATTDKQKKSTIVFGKRRL
jgi:hypothetical protein